MKIDLKLLYRNIYSEINNKNLIITLEGLEPRMRLNYINNNRLEPFSTFSEAVIHTQNLVYPMWNDVRTYQTLSMETEEKNLLLASFSYFKNKNGKLLNY
jgi:hypothetical protein